MQGETALRFELISHVINTNRSLHTTFGYYYNAKLYDTESSKSIAMISSKEMRYEQDNPVPEGTVCTALYDAIPEYHIDLDFKKGEKITIVEPCNVLFFYIGKNEEGKEGVIPINYFTFDSKKPPEDDSTGERYVTSQSGPLQPAPPQIGPPQVAPKPRSPLPRRSPDSPVLSNRPPVAPRTSNTLPASSRMPSQYGDDDAPQASGTSVVDDIDRRPPMPLPPEATNPVNPTVANENFKRTSGWFTPNVQQVWSGIKYVGV